jgi:mercuric ion transport protein
MMIMGKLMGAGVFTTIAASLCCITPVLALIAGSGSIASSFSWIEPARLYLIGLTAAILGFAWYQKLKTQTVDECDCSINEKPKFLHSKIFLLLVTIFASLMIGFPSYAKAFFPKNENASIVAKKSNIQTVELSIKGLSCEACEAEVNNEVTKLHGIMQSTVSYKNRNAIVQFDTSKTTLINIIDAVNTSGYTVINHSLKN